MWFIHVYQKLNVALKAEKAVSVLRNHLKVIIRFFNAAWT